HTPERQFGVKSVRRPTRLLSCLQARDQANVNVCNDSYHALRARLGRSACRERSRSIAAESECDADCEGRYVCEADRREPFGSNVAEAAARSMDARQRRK